MSLIITTKYNYFKNVTKISTLLHFKNVSIVVQVMKFHRSSGKQFDPEHVEFGSHRPYAEGTQS
jgi:hypothetical protein